MGEVPFELLVGRLAEKFGVLPSDVLARGMHYDWRVRLILQQYDQHIKAKADD